MIKNITLKKIKAENFVRYIHLLTKNTEKIISESSDKTANEYIDSLYAVINETVTSEYERMYGHDDDDDDEKNGHDDKEIAPANSRKGNDMIALSSK